jgi:hypothetical protein
MVSSKETRPGAYLASLPPERRKVIAAVRAVVKKHLPKGYVETMNLGMLSYEIPLSRHPDTYNKQPLMYLALAAQKNNYALYITDDAPLDVIGDIVASVSVERRIEAAEAARSR